MNKIASALEWISKILNKHQIPWQLTGGLAAHAYGSTRPINDIDIDIPEDRFAEILDEVKPYITDAPCRIDNPVLDVYAMTLEYQGQEVDIGGAYETRVKDLKTGIWHTVKVDLDNVEQKNVFGVEVPVVNKQDLITYKQWLAVPGNHQEQDIKEIQNSP